MYELKITSKPEHYNIVHNNKILGTIRSFDFNGLGTVSEMIDKANQFDILSKNVKNHITDIERSIDKYIVDSEKQMTQSTMDKLRKQINAANITNKF